MSDPNEAEGEGQERRLSGRQNSHEDGSQQLQQQDALRNIQCTSTLQLPAVTGNSASVQLPAVTGNSASVQRPAVTGNSALVQQPAVTGNSPCAQMPLIAFVRARSNSSQQQQHQSHPAQLIG